MESKALGVSWLPILVGMGDVVGRGYCWGLCRQKGESENQLGHRRAWPRDLLVDLELYTVRRNLGLV